MNKLKKAADTIKRLFNPSGMKNYTIKFKKCIYDTYIDEYGDLCWYEASSNSIHNNFITFFENNEEVIIKKIVVKDSNCTSSYIKFKATLEGYREVFALFNREDYVKRLKIVSPYKP